MLETFKKSPIVAIVEEKNLGEIQVCFENQERSIVSLHVGAIKGELSPVEKKKLILRLFQKTSNLLRNSPNFKNVEYVVICSWIVRQAPKLIQSFGFNYDNVPEDLQRIKKRMLEKYNLKRFDGSLEIKLEHRLVKPEFAYSSLESFIKNHGQNE